MTSLNQVEIQQQLPDLQISFDEGVVLLTLDRPKALNALNDSLLSQLDQALDIIESDPGNRVMIVTGGGERAFVAGADISELRDLSKHQGKKAGRRGQRLFARFEESKLISIAAINGFALGGGLELALACDLRVLSETAVVGLPEVTLGIIPGYGGTQRLTKLVGAGLALELIATGRKIDAEAAQRMGLANRVVPSESLLEVCRELAKEIVANAPLAVNAAKRAVRAATDSRGYDGYYAEAEEFAALCITDDAKEGMSAFFERRKAQFRGS